MRSSAKITAWHCNYLVFVYIRFWALNLTQYWSYASIPARQLRQREPPLSVRQQRPSNHSLRHRQQWGASREGFRTIAVTAAADDTAPAISFNETPDETAPNQAARHVRERSPAGWPFNDGRTVRRTDRLLSNFSASMALTEP